MIFFDCDQKHLMRKANRAVTNQESFSINVFGWRRFFFKITLPLFLKHRKSNLPNWLSKLKFWFFFIFTPFTWVSITYADLAGYEISYEESNKKIILKAVSTNARKS
jgi:hypothetical protein